MAVTVSPATSSSIVQLPTYTVAVLAVSVALHDGFEPSVIFTVVSLGAGSPEGTVRLTS